MNKNSLIIKYQNDTFGISGSKAEIEAFIKWVKRYKRGNFTANAIICKTSTDMIACRLRAKHQKLNLN